MSDNKGKKGAQGKGKGTPTQDKKADAAPAESKQEKVVEKKPVVEKKDDVAQDVRQEEGNASTPTSARKTGATNQGATEKKENRVQQVRESGKGVVKAVLSGDTIVVINLAKNQQGPPQERIISLSNISAPSMGRKRGDKEERDKPFAWDSREFLRKKLIGKPVTYVVEAKMPNKEYGAVFLDNENIALSVVENGWATVRRPNRSEGPLYEALKEMIDAEEAARKAGKGIHDKSKEGTVRPAAKEINPTELFTKLKGQPQTGIVEKVKNGNTLSVTLLPSFSEITIILSGVDCPSSNPNNPEPFGREAKFFTEHHLLGREVSVILEGADKNNFYGTVSYANRYISEELLKQGLGKYVDWSGMRTAFHDRLKAAEQEAKEKKLRIWASYVAPKPLTRQEEKKVAKPGREITGTVVEVANAGCITIQDPSGVEHKIYLSSINVPRQGAPTPAKDESKDDAAERYFAWEGKEYLRRKLIGNRVRCVLDYTREGPPKSQGKGKDAKDSKPEDRNYCSVYLDKNNVAVELVEQGLAKPSNHKGGEQRSRDYEHIIFAENRAQKASKGLYASKEKVATVNIVDISQDVKLAKQKFPFLQRHGKMRGVIEYEFSPSRFKVFVPKENCQIILSLGGVQTPTRESDFFKPALSFVRAKAHQHDIDFDVTAQDTKGAGFIGNVWVNKQSLAAIILEEGYGKIFRGADRDNEMLSAESIAKKKKRGIWVNYDEAEENAKRQAAYEATKEDKKQKQEFVDVVVTEIVDGTTLWVQVVGSDAQKLEELMQKLAVEDNSGEHKPITNELVKAQFTADDTWYRAKILKVMDNNEYKVQYVDYGNTEVIPGSRIRRLDPELKSLAPQATEAVLAFLKTPPVEDEFGREAIEFLRELVWGKTMMANVERREKLPDGGTRLHLSLGDRESQVLVNAALLRAGLARVDRVRGEQYREMLDKLREEESKARQAHHGIWEYGDPGSDEEEDDRRGGKGKGKRT